MSDTPADQRFYELMLRYSQEPDAGRREALESEIWGEYGVERAVLIMDMSGFSILTQRHGIVHYLSMITRMQLTAAPVIKSHGGSVVKFEGDNCYAIFPDALNAIRACIAMNFAFDAANILTDDDLDIRVACGIDYGKLLMPHPRDFYGHCVNRASKLGEDLAEAGEILVGDKAMARVPEGAGVVAEAVSYRVSGIQIDAHLIKYR